MDARIEEPALFVRRRPLTDGEVMKAAALVSPEGLLLTTVIAALLAIAATLSLVLGGVSWVLWVAVFPWLLVGIFASGVVGLRRLKKWMLEISERDGGLRFTDGHVVIDDRDGYRVLPWSSVVGWCHDGDVFAIRFRELLIYGSFDSLSGTASEVRNYFLKRSEILPPQQMRRSPFKR